MSGEIERPVAREVGVIVGEVFLAEDPQGAVERLTNADLVTLADWLAEKEACRGFAGTTRGLVDLEAADRWMELMRGLCE